MARDLFAERGIVPRKKAPIPQGRDLFAESGIIPKRKQPQSEQELLAQLSPQEQFISALFSGIAGANKSFGDTAHGIMQPALESEWVNRELSPNLRRASQEIARERNDIYEREKSLNPLSAMGGYGAGEVAKAVPGIAAGGAGLVPLAGRGLVGASVGGGLSGAASGGSEYVNPGQSRLENARYGALIGALLPGAGRLVSAPFKYANRLSKAYPAEKLGEQIIAAKSAAKEKYSKLYSDIFKEAEDSGINHIRKPIKETVKKNRRLHINQPKLKPSNPNKYGEAYAAFQKNPTPKLAQEAQSDLGKLIYEIRSSKTGKLSSEKARIEELSKLREGIINDLTTSFEKKSPELAKRYKKVGEGYKKDVIEYDKNNAFRKFEEGGLTKDELVDALVKNKDFRNKMKHMHPELITRKNAPKVAIGLGLGGTTLAHKLGLFEALLGGNHD